MQNSISRTVLFFGAMIFFGLQIQAVSAFTLEPTGMAKPISDLRDYNGTYEGSIGTGGIGYSGGTLYRDNQDNGAISGCVGEGCGKHPGVDIPIPTGRGVYSSTWGQVMISRCDPTWGGLIVIRSQSPWDYQTVYVIYAHLSARHYSSGGAVLPGHYVSAGTYIGKSGGGAGDPCRGNSTGPHLHFQIDRDDGSPEPYYPPKGRLNVRDDDFQVSFQTLNPIVFLVGGYRWTFAQNGNRELWDIFNSASWGVGDNALWIDGNFDPYIRRGGQTYCGRSRACGNFVNAEATQFQHVYMDLYNDCSGVGKVYFTTNSSPRWSEDKTVVYFSTFGYQNTHVWMSSNPRWTGIITGLRIDPADQCYVNIWDPNYFGEITIER